MAVITGSESQVPGRGACPTGRSARAAQVSRTRRVANASGWSPSCLGNCVMPPSAQLDRSLIHGIAWTSVIRWGTQLLSWVVTLFVAHLLAPSDYGLVGMALIYFGLAQLLCDAGLTGAIVQVRGLQERELASIGAVAALVGIALCAVTLVSAPYVATFFREGRVSGILMVLSLTFPVRSLQILPRGLLMRDLQFRTLAFMDGIESLVVMTTTLVMALAGAGYWSLVGGPIVGTVTSTALCFWWRPHRLALPRDLESLRPALRMGWHLLVSGIAWYAYSNADFTVVGRVLGTSALGAYTLAWTIASVPVDRISSLVGGSPRPFSRPCRPIRQACGGICRCSPRGSHSSRSRCASVCFSPLGTSSPPFSAIGGTA